VSELFFNLLISIGSGLFVAFGVPRIRDTVQKRRLRGFWGNGALGNDFILCYGALTDSRLTEPNPPKFRYVKRFHSGRSFSLVGPWGSIVGACEVRSASYIINTLSSYRKTPITFTDDYTAFQNLNTTLIAFGSGSSNEVTDFILREPENRFLNFVQEDETYFVYDKITKKKFIGFQLPIKKDYGIILKIPNQRCRGQFLFVCAGLGEWGTSGAAWYLATNWKELNSEFHGSFGIVVEVDLGSDTSSKRVFP
jgi:hypothetical protein